MKKSKLSITLVTGFIAAMALTACNDVTKSDKAIVTFTPYGSDEPIALITDNVYNKYRNQSSGVSMFYDKILEVLTRYQFDNGFDKGELKKSQIENWAANQVQEQKENAKKNAENNGTSYDDEWDAILESNKVENEKEYKEKFIYEKEKEVMKNWYAGDDQNAYNLRKEFIGVDANGDKVESKVSPAMPYHIRHILVKVDESSEAQAKFSKGTVSEAQAKLLSDTVTTLASGNYSFSQVAKMYSEDGSGSNGGDVGIMTADASSGSLGMVSEFQLGLYAYDNLYDAANAADAKAANIKEGLGITTDVISALPANVGQIPYSVFVKMGKYADVTADKFGNKLANGSSTLYPRNILWNKYLNMHNVFVITNYESAAYDSLFGSANAKDEFATLVNSTVDSTAPTTRFANNVLTDEKGNVIVGVRSQFGLHLMVIEKSMYDYADLMKYYSTKLPGEKAAFEGDDDYTPDSYVGYIQSQSTEDYKKRADDIKSKITSFDKTYDYRLYQYLLTQVTVNYSGAAEGLGDQINAYIAAQQENNIYKQKDNIAKVWRTYNELLDVQDVNRSAQFNIINSKGAAQNNLTRLVSELAADDFMKLYEDPSANSALYAKFAEGGEYYYYA